MDGTKMHKKMIEMTDFPQKLVSDLEIELYKNKALFFTYLKNTVNNWYKCKIYAFSQAQ